MNSLIWAALAAIALLWPARLAGPLDGAPLDTLLDAAVLGMAAAALIAVHPALLRRAIVRGFIVALIVWKAGSAAVLVQDGWCVRFTSPVPLYLEDVRVPHSWDVRADWRSEIPRCSAVMTEGYWILERFPAWFYNLPPVDQGSSAAPQHRPPNVNLELDVDGYLHTDEPGLFQVAMLEDVHAKVFVDGVEVADPATGIAVSPGLHRVGISGTLVRSHWSLEPRWNGANVWSATTATMAAPSRLDHWIRPWGRFVPALLVVGLLAAAVAAVSQRAGSAWPIAGAAGLAAALALTAMTGRESFIRVAPLLLIPIALVKLPRRLQNLFGASLLLGLPFLVLAVVASRAQVGIFTWYSPGDDWWMFQRFAYRIFMQGYWLEGGQVTFWFQPLYRWIAGSLHMVFGDSSVGEFYWDAACILMGSCFAFLVTRQVAGFRWAAVAGTTTLAVFTLGPAWYLIGRGLSEITSMGFIYAAAMCALRGRHGHWPSALAAGVLALLAFYTRLNNLPMALAVTWFALPVSHPVSGWTRATEWIAPLSRPVVASVLGSIALGLWLFTARTYYYTGVPSMLFGTQAGMLSVWQTTPEGLTPLQDIASNVAMVLSMNDPPRLDPRAIPVIAGFVAALLGVVGVRPFNRLPLNAVALCLAGVAGALVARGSAYPGRFSVHLIPVTVALTMFALSLVVGHLQTSRSSPPVPQSPGTT